MLPINPSSDVKQISALSKSVGAKEENRPATHEGKRGEEAAALTAAAQGARSRLPALTDGKRAPSAKAPEGSRDTAPCWDTEPPHTVRPFPDPAGQQSLPFTLLAPPNLPAHARRKRETFTTAPGDPNTCSCSGPAGAPNTVGYKTTGNTNIDLYFKFTALYLQKRAGGKRLPAQSPRGWGGLFCTVLCVSLPAISTVAVPALRNGARPLEARGWGAGGARAAGADGFS